MSAGKSGGENQILPVDEEADHRVHEGMKVKTNEILEKKAQEECAGTQPGGNASCDRPAHTCGIGGGFCWADAGEHSDIIDCPECQAASGAAEPPRSTQRLESSSGASTRPVNSLELERKDGAVLGVDCVSDGVVGADFVFQSVNESGSVHFASTVYLHSHRLVSERFARVG